MRYCLDTNVVIQILKGDIITKSKIDKLNENDITWCITPVIACELFKGVYLAEKQEEVFKLINDFVRSVTVLEFNELSCKLFGQRYAELARKGKQTQEFDLMIASNAMAHNAALVTMNEKDFMHIRGLKTIIL